MNVMDMIPMTTNEEISRAVEALPRTLELAAEDNPFYQGLAVCTGVGLMFAPFNMWVNYWKDVLPDVRS